LFRYNFQPAASKGKLLLVRYPGFEGTTSYNWHLDSDRIRRKSSQVDGVHIEVRDINESLETGSAAGCGRIGFVCGEDRQEALLERDEGEPEHGADEEVHEVLDLWNHFCV